MASRTVSVRLQAEVGQFIGGMNAAAASTLRLGESATKSSAQAKSGFDLAGKGALLAGAAVVGGLGLAISKAADFERSMSAAAAATRATGVVLGDLRGAAMKAGADTAFSATEAAGAITEMGKAGVSAKDIIGGGLTGALSLAAAGQLDVAEAAGIAATAMVQFGLAGKDLPHVADLLAAGAGKAMGSVEDLSNALKYIGPVAAGMGISIEETTGTLALFASQGILSEQAGTSLRGMLTALTSPSKLAAATMGDLGITAFDAKGNFIGLAGVAEQLHGAMSGLTEAERSEALGRIFGNEQITAARVLYQGGAKAVEDWTKKVNDSGYAAETAAKLQDNLRGDLEKLSGSFETLMITIGQGAQGPLRDLVQMLGGLVDGVSGAINAFADLPGPVQAGIVAFAAWAVVGDRVMGTLRSMGGSLAPMRDGWRSFGEALDYARANGDGLGTVLQSVGSYAGGQTLSAVKALGRAIGPELAVAAAAFVVTSFVQGLRSITEASDEAKAASEGLAKALTLTDLAADQRSIRGAIDDVDGLVEVLAEAGVSSEDAIDGLLGNANAQRKVLDALREYKAEVYSPNGAGGDRASKDAREAVLAYEELASGYDGAAGSARYFGSAAASTSGAVTGAAEAIAAFFPQVAEMGTGMAATAMQTEAAAQANEDWLKSLQEIGAGFVQPLGVYKGLLEEKTAAERTAAEETAASTESSTDSWEDYVSDVDVSLDELATRLEEQLLAQDNWRANIATITQRGGLEVGQILAGMGEEGVQLAAQMANGTDAEFNRMADLLIEDARRGGAGAAAALDTQMKVMAIIGRDGSKATRKAISEELGIGVGEVQAIADQYGVNLATGINPILTALGKRMVGVQRDFKNQRNLWSGGYTGDGGKYEPKGVVHGGEYVLTKEQTSRLGIDQIEAFANSGYAKGGFVTAADVPKPYSTAPYAMPISTAGDATMQKGFDEVTDWMKANATLGGVAGAGAVGGAWGSLWNLVKSQIPQARINSTFRAGDPGYHGRNKAIDFGFGSGPGGAGSAGLASINRLLHDSVGRNLAELIYDGIGDDRPDLKNGKPLTYSAGTRAEHRNHVHAAVYDQGGWLQPGYTMAYNGTGAPERVLTSREFSGGSGPGSGGGVVTHTREVQITAVAAPNEEALARRIVDRQRDLEFLHG